MKKINTQYHPFNSNKLIYHANYWSEMESGKIPAPVLVTLDPISLCNFHCSYCNASFLMEKISEEYSDYVIDNVGGFLKIWGTKAVCIAGGGEPLMHKRIGDLLRNLNTSGIEIGVITNGSLINKCVDELSLCNWVGISVDAGDENTHAKLKNIRPAVFKKVIGNVANLCKSYPYLEVTYKFLAHPVNINSIYNAVKLAKEIGCRYFHLRPCGKTWYNLSQPNLFSPLDIAIADAQMNMARTDFEDENFKVFGIVSKFSKNWEIEHNFNKCYAVGMTAVIEPNNNVGVCCDRRGDSRVVLGEFEKLEDILSLWSSEKHWDIINSINLKDCPRCTYSPHNQIYENFILNDDVCKNFI